MKTVSDFDRRLGGWLEEGAQSVPDWLVEQALDQAHATPQLSAGIRWPWEGRRLSGLRLAIVLGILAASLLAIALGAGSNRSDVPPIDTSTFLPVPDADLCWTQEHRPVATTAADPMLIPDTDVVVRLPSVPESMLGAQAVPGAVGLAVGAPGLSYGLDTASDNVVVSSRARGIVIAVVTGAQSHGSLAGRPLGGTPEELVSGLRDVAGFTVRDVTPVRLAERPAVSARVSTAGIDGWKHIDRRSGADEALDCVVSFTLASRVTVLDVDGELVLVQAWAATDAGLEGWLPAADALLEPIRLTRS